MIAHQEYVERMARLRQRVAEAGLETFLVSGEDSIYYLTGVSYRPLERPFFILVRPSAPAVLLVPALERQHLRAAPNVSDVHHYWDYPAPAGRGWADRLLELLGRDTQVGVEPSLPQEIAGRLSHLSPRALALVEALRVVKSPAELEMIKHTARYTDLAVRKLLEASYYGVSELELIAQGRAVQLQIMREVGSDFDLTHFSAGQSVAEGLREGKSRGVPAAFSPKLSYRDVARLGACSLRLQAGHVRPPW